MTDHFRTPPFDWEDVRYFLALVRAGSLSGAARALHVNHATVGRRIGALEAALGHVLFERRADGYRLTFQGEAAMAKALVMERSAMTLVESLDEGRLHGTVRLATVRSLADLFLIDRLGALRREHPGIALEVITDVRVASLARREADVALRLGRPKDSDLAGRKLADVHYAFYAAPDLAGGMEASGMPMIGYDGDVGAGGIAEAEWLERNFDGRRFAFRSNSNGSQAAAARAGFGAVMLPRYMGDLDTGLAEVELRPVLPPRELWLLSPRELARLPRVRIVLEAVTDVVMRYRTVLEGTGNGEA